MKKIDKPIVASFFLYFCISTVGYSQSDYTVGVFYFPGFADDNTHPWSEISPYEEATPDDSLLVNNQYNSSRQSIVDNELLYMSNYGVSVVIFDWYWTKSYYKRYGKHFHEDALNNYFSSANSYKIKFALMWDNFNAPLRSIEEIDEIIEHLATKYLSDSRYYKINGRPVFYIFDTPTLNSTAQSLGFSLAELISYIRNKFKIIYGIDPLFYAGAVRSVDNVSMSNDGGMDGFFQYNYHGPKTYWLRNGSPANHSRSYSELMDVYSDWWTWFKSLSSVAKYIPVTTSGWNRKPWGGSSDPLHDDSVSTPEQFQLHLEKAKSFIDENKILTNNQVLVCCWNEFGEGSYIAPTKKYGFKYLEKIKTVFGDTSIMETGSSTDSGTSTDTGSSTDSGTSTETSSSTDSGTSTETGSSTDSGTSTETGSSTDSGTSTETSSSTDSGTSTDTGSSTDSGTSTDNTASSSGSASSSSGSSSSGSSSSLGGSSTSGGSLSSTNNSSNTPVIATFGFSAGGITSDGSNENTNVAGDGNTDNHQEINNMTMIENTSSSFKAVLRFQNSSNVLISSSISGKVLVDEQKNSGDEIAVNSNEPILLHVSDLQAIKIYYNGELLSQSDLAKITDESGILLQ